MTDRERDIVIDLANKELNILLKHPYECVDYDKINQLIKIVNEIRNASKSDFLRT